MRPEEEEAGRLLQKHGVGVMPVPVEDIARLEGAQIARHRFEGNESGFILRDGRQTIIGVNTLTSRRRQRFTIAHEVGHLLLHEGRPLIVDHSVRVNLRDEVSAMASDVEEIQANAFAAALLMPREFLLERLGLYVTKVQNSAKSLSREDLIGQLGREFDVSAEAMGYRLINLGVLAT
jgi:Zn-dependent peptidase ImmA (M78 family)